MNTISSQTFDVSEEDLKLAVGEFIEKRFGAGKPLTVSIKTAIVSVGYGMSERDTTVFKVSAVRAL